MEAYVLELLLSRGWRRGGEVYWTQEDAEHAGRQLLKRRLARRVRVLRASVALEPVAILPKLAEPVPFAPSPEGGRV